MVEKDEGEELLGNEAEVVEKDEGEELLGNEEGNIEGVVKLAGEVVGVLDNEVTVEVLV